VIVSPAGIEDLTADGAGFLSFDQCILIGELSGKFTADIRGFYRRWRRYSFLLLSACILIGELSGTITRRYNKI